MKWIKPAVAELSPWQLPHNICIKMCERHTIQTVLLAAGPRVHSCYAQGKQCQFSVLSMTSLFQSVALGHLEDGFTKQPKRCFQFLNPNITVSFLLFVFHIIYLLSVEPSIQQQSEISAQHLQILTFFGGCHLANLLSSIAPLTDQTLLATPQMARLTYYCRVWGVVGT